MRWAILLLFLLPGCESPSAETPEPPPPAPRRGDQVLDLLEARARDALAAIDRPRDRAAWEREKPRLQKRLTDALGLPRLPRPSAPKVRVVGTLARDGYRIEKLVYPTLP